MLSFKTYLEEGVNDPAIFKAVFLAGGPGSGKSFIVGKTGLMGLGFKLVNSDPAFEVGLKKAGLTMDPDDIGSAKGQEVRKKAKAITKTKQDMYLNGRLGLVIDGTGKDYAKIEKQVNELRALGYSVKMIFVNTDLETALARNQKRSRSLPDKMVEKMWKDVQRNMGKFQNLFRDRMIIVDNSDGSNSDAITLAAYRKIASWVKEPVKDRNAVKWIKSQQKSK